MCICKEGDPQHVSCWWRLHCCGGRQSTHFVRTVSKEGEHEGRRGNEKGKRNIILFDKKTCNMCITTISCTNRQIAKTRITKCEQHSLVSTTTNLVKCFLTDSISKQLNCFKLLTLVDGFYPSLDCILFGNKTCNMYNTLTLYK